jgi:ribosomal protein L37E
MLNAISQHVCARQVAYNWVKNNCSEIERRYGPFLVSTVVNRPSCACHTQTRRTFAVDSGMCSACGLSSVHMPASRLIIRQYQLQLQLDRHPLERGLLVAFANALQLLSGSSCSVMVAATLVAFCLVRG